MPWELPEVLDSNLVREGWQELKTLRSLASMIDGVDNSRLKISALETVWYMRNQLLRDADWASMAHSLEVRMPLVDIELFRTVVRLVHTHHAPSKQNMAASPRMPLPDEVLKRRKTGFLVPTQKWLMDLPHNLDKQQKYGARALANTIYTFSK